MQYEYRQELKYVIKQTDFCWLKQQLTPFLEPDKHAKQTGYNVRSLYFDTLYNKDLFDVLSGLRNKTKIRLRLYEVDDDSIKLELKQKFNSQCLKRYIYLNQTEVKQMINSQYDFLVAKQNKLAYEFYQKLKLNCYRPRVIVSYNRTAYVYKTNNTRITYDSNIKASLIARSFLNQDLSQKPVLDMSLGILEVKYNNFLMPHLKGIIQKLNVLPESFSKYANSRLVYS